MSGPETVTFQKGEFILEQGQNGDDAFLVQAGQVAIFLRETNGPKLLGTIKPGGVFGEMALIDPAPRSANARALETTICFRITREALTRALNQAPPLVRYLLRSFVRNIRAANGKQLDLPADTSTDTSTDTSEGIHMSERDPSRRILERRSFADGSFIFRQDSHGKTAFLLQSGMIDLLRQEAGEPEARLLRRLAPGEVFGELALLRDTPRYASAQAVGGVMVELIRHDQFDDILAKAPAFLQALIRIYVEMIGSGEKR